MFRGTDFLKLQKTEAFSKLEWTFVTKTVGSPIPSAFFLPDRIKPMREMLLDATGSRRGSAQVVILVDGKVHDIYLGSKDADFYQVAVASILDSIGKTTYPGERCLKRDSTATCVKKI